MSRLVVVISCLILSLAMNAAPADAQTEIAGRWIAAYVDSELGIVEGDAFVDDGGGVEIIYRHPHTGAEIALGGTVTRTETGATIRLSAPGLGAADAVLAPWGQGLDTPPGAPVRLWLGEGESRLDVGVPAAPDGAVTLDLMWNDGGDVLSGTWRHAVDPASGRIAPGQGRTGRLHLRYDGSGGADVEGAEGWRRLTAEIVIAFATEDQFRRDDGIPDYPHPFDATGKVTSLGGDRRVLFVLGHEMPQDWRDRIEVESLDPNVAYRVRAVPAVYDDPAYDPYWVERGWDILAGQVDPERLAELKRADVVLVDAILSPGATPGPKGFKLNGAEAAWLLQFGDYTGRLSISRSIGIGQSDPAQYLYSGETAMVEIVLDDDRDYAEIPVFLSLARADGEEPEFILLEGERAIPAYRDADEPRRYRTRPFRLTDPEYLETFIAENRAIGVLPGDRLMASLGEEPIFNLAPNLASVKILHSPDDLKAALTGEAGARARTWEEAVASAVACADIDGYDPNWGADSEADRFDNLILFAGTIVSTEVTVGQHAAVLLLRDVFVDLMTAQATSLREPLSDLALQGYRKLVEAEIYDERWPLGSVEIDSPDGGKTAFASTFVEKLLTDTYGIEGDRLAAYQAESARQARRLYANAIDTARQTAAEIDDCEIEDLLEIVGQDDFAEVARLAKHLAVTIEQENISAADGSAAWRPQIVANRRFRAWFDQVPLITDALNIQRELASQDNDAILTGIALATIPLAFFEAPIAMIAVTVIDGLDVAITAGRTIYNEVELSAETRFALGSSAILGAGRFRAAEARSYEWFTGALATLGAGAGAAYGAFQTYEGLLTITRREAVARGTALAQSISLEDLPRLTPTERADLLEAIVAVRSMAIRARGVVLKDAEKQVFRLSREISAARQMSYVDRPAWARHLSPDAYASLGRRAAQPHVVKLFDANPQRMAELLETPGAVDLLTLPQKSMESFERAVEKLKTLKGSQGEGGYLQIDPNEAKLGHLDFTGGARTSASDNVKVAKFRIHAGAGDAKQDVGTFARYLEPDGELGTGGNLLTLALARINRLEGVDTLVRSLPFPLKDGGVPLGIYMNLRSMLALGITYGDQALKAVKLSTVLSTNTCIELAWLRKAYPDLSWGELARYTHSFRYTKNFLEQAGFKVDDVIIKESEALRRFSIRSQDSWFDGDDLAAFAERFGFGVDDAIDFGYDIYIKVSPL